MIRLLVKVFASVMLFFATNANALLINISLDAGQQVQPVNLGIFMPVGAATIDFNPATGEISINGTYSDMTSDVAAAHLHGLAPAGSNAGILLPLVVSGGTTGTFSGSGVLDPIESQGLLDDQTYINVHTSQNPAGEIRGQVTVPEPETLALVLLGTLALFSRRRNRTLCLRA